MSLRGDLAKFVFVAFEYIGNTQFAQVKLCGSTDKYILCMGVTICSCV